MDHKEPSSRNKRTAALKNRDKNVVYSSKHLRNIERILEDDKSPTAPEIKPGKSKIKSK